MDCLWTTLPPVCSECARSLIIFLWTPLSSDSSFNRFHCLIADLNIACFSFSGSTVLPPGGQILKKSREMLMSFMSRISQTQLMFFFVRQSFLFWNQISYLKGYVYSSLIVETKSERYQFWKRSFENQAF
jgi:hypothetical protein